MPLKFDKCSNYAPSKDRVFRAEFVDPLPSGQISYKGYKRALLMYGNENQLISSCPISGPIWRRWCRANANLAQTWRIRARSEGLDPDNGWTDAMKGEYLRGDEYDQDDEDENEVEIVGSRNMTPRPQRPPSTNTPRPQPPAPLRYTTPGRATSRPSFSVGHVSTSQSSLAPAQRLVAATASPSPMPDMEHPRVRRGAVPACLSKCKGTFFADPSDLAHVALGAAELAGILLNILDKTSQAGSGPQDAQLLMNAEIAFKDIKKAVNGTAGWSKVVELLRNEIPTPEAPVPEGETDFAGPFVSQVDLTESPPSRPFGLARAQETFTPTPHPLGTSIPFSLTTPDPFVGQKRPRTSDTEAVMAQIRRSITKPRRELDDLDLSRGPILCTDPAIVGHDIPLDESIIQSFVVYVGNQVVICCNAQVAIAICGFFKAARDKMDKRLTLRDAFKYLGLSRDFVLSFDTTLTLIRDEHESTVAALRAARQTPVLSTGECAAKQVERALKRMESVGWGKEALPAEVIPRPGKMSEALRWTRADPCAKLATYKGRAWGLKTSNGTEEIASQMEATTLRQRAWAVLGSSAPSSREVSPAP
ncbi:Fc.00g067800.m01.CDS01 [Cosmosporella sp. VM-42]